MASFIARHTLSNCLHSKAIIPLASSSINKARKTTLDNLWLIVLRDLYEEAVSD